VPKKIGLLGGTFDPIHLGHLRAAEEVYERLSLDKIFFVPSGRPPHKYRPDLSPFEVRFKMVCLAIEGISHFEALDLEGRREGPSYSVVTLEILRQERRGEEIYFIMGLDAFLEIETWHSFERLPSLAHLVVVTRGPGDKKDFVDKVLRVFPLVQETKWGFIHPQGYSLRYLEITRIDISSTMIRRLVRQKHSIRFLLPEEVRAFILRQGLYSG